MDTIIYIIIIYMIIVVIVGFWIASMIDKHHRDLDNIRKNTHVVIEDLKSIAEDIEETNRLLDDMERRMLERIGDIEIEMKYK